MQHWLNLNTNSTEGSYVTDHTHTQMLAVQGAVNACSTLTATLPSPRLRLKELSGGHIVCPYLRLLDRLSSVSLFTTTWVEPPWLSSCITSIYGTHKRTWSSGISFLRYLWVKYGTVSLPIFNTFSCGFNPSRHHNFQLFSYNKVMVLKKEVTKTNVLVSS